MKLSTRCLSVNTTILLLLALLTIGPTSGLCDTTPQPSPDYRLLVEQLKRDTMSVDFTALRMAYSQSPGYNPYAKQFEIRKNLLKALDAKDYEAIARHSEELLAKNYLDMEAHFFCSMAYREMGNRERHAFHVAVVKGLIGSIYASGDGLKPETAYTVIDTDEEYFLLRVNGYSVIRQKLLQKNGMHYDAMEVENMKTGARSTYYFNVEIPFSWLNRQLNTKKPEPQTGSGQ